MFNNTNIKETLPLKLSKNLPKNAVGISFFESKIIDPNTIVKIVDNSKEIDNNNPYSKPEMFIKYNNSQNEILLGNETFNKFLVGETLNVTITNHFKNDKPLFYKTELSFPIRTKNIPDENNIKFVNELNYEIQLHDVKVSYENIEERDEATDLYNVIIYSASKIDEKVFVRYNAFVNNNANTNIKEEVNFHDALTQNIDFQLIKKEEPGIINGISVTDTVAYITPEEHLRFEDKRNKIDILYKIITDNYSTLAIRDSIISPEFIIDKQELNLPEEGNYDENAYYLLNGKTPIEHLLENNTDITIEDLEDEIFRFEILDDFDDKRIKENIIINLEPSGNLPIGVKVYCNTGYGYRNQIKPDGTLQYDYEENTHYNKFAIMINDINSIKLKKPLLNFSDNNWNIQVDYGYFYQKKDGVLYKYVLDDVKEKYDSDIGYPYNRITKEKPLIINNDLIKTRMNNIVNINNVLKLYKYNQYGLKEEIKIIKIDNEEGLIHVDNININDDLFVDYIYKKNEVNYNGFYNEKSEKFIYLDLKPTKDNYSILSFLNNKISNNLFLINRPIYFYLKPKYKVIEGEKVEINTNEFVYHVFEPKTLETEDLLIGSVIVSPNISKENIDLIDIRKHGGGIKREIKNQINTEKDIDTNNFWDLGYWNGIPYNENNVMVININDSILKINGGNLSKEEVERKVKKWIGFGNLPIINYVKSYKSNNVNFEKTTSSEILNKTDYEIKFFLEQYRTVSRSKHKIEVYGQEFVPQLHIDRIDEPLDHEIKSVEEYSSKRKLYMEPFFENVNTTKKPKLENLIYSKENKDFKNSIKTIKTYNTVNIKNASIETYEK